MKPFAFLLLAALLSAPGCMDMRGARKIAESGKKEAEVAPPARPPITEDEVTESDAAAAIQALTDELNREERR
jgi:hypothetical protein